MTTSSITTEAWTADRLLQEDLSDRPFLHEQGNTVTRGFVRFLEVKEGGWTLFLRDVEFLNKMAGVWVPDADEDDYGGPLDRLSVTLHRTIELPVVNVGIELSCYGIFIFIGVQTDNPWADNDWPQLDTEMLAPGPMRS